MCFFKDAIKVEKVLRSCTTTHHYMAATKMLELFKEKYKKEIYKEKKTNKHNMYLALLEVEKEIFKSFCLSSSI